jgi:hypothetical protein
MNTKREDRAAAKIPRWADAFPYVNGGCSPAARRAALQQDRPVLPAARRRPRLDQDQPRHLRVDDPGRRRGRGARRAGHALHQRAQHPEGAEPAVPRRPARALEEAGDNPRTLLNLRKRMAKIRVFDPACGSGNFLVIAYKEMRAIEAEINRRRGEPDRASESRSPTFAGSSCATSRRRSPAWRWSSPSTSATCCIGARSWRWPSSCPCATRTGSPAATRCGSTG